MFYLQAFRWFRQDLIERKIWWELSSNLLGQIQLVVFCGDGQHDLCQWSRKECSEEQWSTNNGLKVCIGTDAEDQWTISLAKHSCSVFWPESVSRSSLLLAAFDASHIFLAHRMYSSFTWRGSAIDTIQEYKASNWCNIWVVRSTLSCFSDSWARSGLFFIHCNKRTLC